MFIHPYLIEEHIRQREQQLRRLRGGTCLASPIRGCPTGYQAARRRAGWALVEIGLVLVQGCPDD